MRNLKIKIKMVSLNIAKKADLVINILTTK